MHVCSLCLSIIGPPNSRGLVLHKLKCAGVVSMYSSSAWPDFCLYQIICWVFSMPGSDESTEAKLQLCCDFHGFSLSQPSLTAWCHGWVLIQVSFDPIQKLNQKWEVAALLQHYRTNLVLGLLELSHRQTLSCVCRPISSCLSHHTPCCIERCIRFHSYSSHKLPKFNAIKYEAPQLLFSQPKRTKQ